MYNNHVESSPKGVIKFDCSCQMKHHGDIVNEYLHVLISQSKTCSEVTQLTKYSV